MLKKLSLLSLSAVGALAMHTFEINVNDKDLGLSLKLDMGQFGNNVEPGTTFVGAKFLKASDDHSDIENGTDIKPFYEINFLKTKSIGDAGLSLGLGVKVNYNALGDAKFISIPLGLEGIYQVPKSDIIPITINASVYYAPEVLTIEDANSFLEYGVNVRFEVIENGLIVLGYRNINTDYKIDNIKTDVNYNHSGYLGFKFAF